LAVNGTTWSFEDVPLIQTPSIDSFLSSFPINLDSKTGIWIKTESFLNDTWSTFILSLPFRMNKFFFPLIDFNSKLNGMLIPSALFNSALHQPDRIDVWAEARN